ncbi:hypothetical protein D3C86_1978790 [compost metagenome]
MPVGQAHRPTGTGLAQARRDGTVGGGPAVGDLRQFSPDPAGELAAGHVQGHAELSERAGEIRRQLRFDLLQMRVVPRRHGITETVLQRLDRRVQ